MKRSVFFNNNRPISTDNSLIRCFGTDPTLFRTTTALRGWSPEVDLFIADPSHRR